MGLSVEAEHKIMFYIHIIQFVLVVAAIVVSAVKIFLPGIRLTRTDTWVLGVAAKSLAIMSYMVLTERVARLRRFASLKANMILSIVETVFWFAAFIMPAMNFGKCQAPTGCILTGVAIGLGATLAVLSIPVTAICTHHWLFFRKHGVAITQQNDPRERNDQAYGMVEAGIKHDNGMRR